MHARPDLAAGCAGETWGGEQLALVLTAQLLPAPAPPARAAYLGSGPGRVAVRAALRSGSAELVAGVEADLQGFVQELFQGAHVPV
jgi:hypothetical protein